MSIAALIRSMAAAGATPEAIAIAVEAIEAAHSADAERRAKQAERKRRQRDSHGTVTGQSRDNAGTVTAGSPDKEKIPHTPLKEINPSPSLRSVSSGVCLLRTAGVPAGVLADWQAVRKAKKAGPITETVAKATIREADKAGVSVDAAVRMAAERGWQGFKAEWAATEARAGPGGRAPKTNYFAEEALRLENERLGRTQGFSGGDGGGIVIEAEAGDGW